MPTKKPKRRADSDRSGNNLPIVSMLEKLSPEQQARVDKLIPAARAVVTDIEDRMVALATAAVQRWNPDANLHEADEDGPPVLDLDEFLETIDEIGECATIRAISLFFGLPESVVDPILSEKLKSAYVDTTHKVKGNDKGFVIHRGRRQQKGNGQF